MTKDSKNMKKIISNPPQIEIVRIASMQLMVASGSSFGEGESAPFASSKFDFGIDISEL